MNVDGGGGGGGLTENLKRIGVDELKTVFSVHIIEQLNRCIYTLELANV